MAHPRPALPPGATGACGAGRALRIDVELTCHLDPLRIRCVCCPLAACKCAASSRARNRRAGSARVALAPCGGVKMISGSVSRAVCALYLPPPSRTRQDGATCRTHLRPRCDPGLARASETL